MGGRQQALKCGDGTIVSCIIVQIWQDAECGCTRGFALMGNRHVEVAYWQGDEYWYEQCDCREDVSFCNGLAEV